MQNDITLIKRNQLGIEVWRYAGQLLIESPRGVLVAAAFNRSDLPFHGVVFKQNDRFLELYLKDRWFNIYEIHDRDTDEIKCWYCNVTRPAIFQPDYIAYDDLALDLLVYPDGCHLVLDEEEFRSLQLSQQDIQNARQGLSQLVEILKNPTRFDFNHLLGRDPE